MESLQFKEFLPDPALRKKAERALDKIIEHAPIELHAGITIEKTAESYRCEMVIRSEHCPMRVEEAHRLAAIALDKAELGVLRKLERWRAERYRRLDNMPGRQPANPGTA